MQADDPRGWTALPFHPVLTAWFHDRYGSPTAVQRKAWQHIQDGQNILISSPTGSGKTLAALMPCLDELVRQESCREPGVRVLYITPLRALNNDIVEHLELYEADMRVLGSTMDQATWPGFRVAVRTGDTTPSKRTAMLKNPPDVLVTTPESLYILLTSKPGRRMLETVQRVIVDEIHDLARSTRGTHLSLSLERLEALANRPLQRIGLSATQRPLERVAQFLGGWAAPDVPRSVTILEAGSSRANALSVVTPRRDLSQRHANGIWAPLVETLSEIVETHRSVVMFVNNRRLCERVTHELNHHAGYELARSHHGSVAREQRLETERLFKSGACRCIIATSSLELGIDVGHVDVVVQIDSPGRVSSAIQRIGRAEHRKDGISKGIFVLKTVSDVFELAVILSLVSQGEVDEIHVVRQRLDILSQQIVSMAAMEEWTEQDLLRLVRKSDCYATCTEEDLRQSLRMIGGAFPFLRPLVTWHPEARRVSGQPSTAMAALMGAGTIPSSSGYSVYHSDSNIRIGELDEEYVHESRVGDVFHLGASAWRIVGISSQAVYVKETRKRYGEVPFWRGEQDGRSFDLGEQVGAWMDGLHARLCESTDGADARETTQQWLQERYFLDQGAAEYAIRTIVEQDASVGVPTHRRVIVEVFRGETRETHVVIHSVFGLKFNRTWMSALEIWLKDQGDSRFYAHSEDNGIHFVFEEWNPMWLHAVWEVTEANAEHYLRRALPSTPQFAQTFRRQAETALLLSRGWTRTPAWKRRLQSDALLRDALQTADSFPLLRAAEDACMTEGFDLPHVRHVLQGIGNGQIQLTVHESVVPSPLGRLFLSGFAETKLYENDQIAADVQRLLERLDAPRAEALWDTAEADAVRERQDVDSADEAMDKPDTMFCDPNLWLEFLADRHHLIPGRRLTGIEGLRQVIQELQGLYLPHTHWESIIFPGRIMGYSKQDLDLLCATGEVQWRGKRAEGQKEGRIAFFPTEADLYTPRIDLRVSDGHAELLEKLRSSGASFMASLQAGTGMSGTELIQALLDLVWEGVVSGDQFAPIRKTVPVSGRKSHPVLSAIGRWYAVPEAPTGEQGDAIEERFIRFVRARLRQFGLVSRAMFGDDSPIPWEGAKAALHRLEEWGLVTRGLFIDGIPSIQFSDRSLLSRLTRQESSMTGVCLIPAVDPANPYGTFLPWPTDRQAKFARKPGNYLVLINGRWSMWMEGNGKRIYDWTEDFREENWTQAFSALVKQYGVRKIQVETYNGVPTATSHIGPVLKAMGADKNGTTMTLWSLHFR